jgi:chromatin segregation and condensation protein Rec8/ScpA/Scc1 (kleisin family)
VFLALLELIRQRKILVYQGDGEVDMEILPAPQEHRDSYMEASLPLREEAGPNDNPAEVI